MNEDKQLLAVGYRYAARTPDFIGGALRTQREKVFLLQEQQRVLLGIQGEQYNTLWVRLQAMPLPHCNQFALDLRRIVAKVQSDVGGVAALNLERLEVLIRVGLE